jgi:hypothetical protein
VDKILFPASYYTTARVPNPLPGRGNRLRKWLEFGEGVQG